MSYPAHQTGRMKLINSFWLGDLTGETIATFGAARLVKKLNGKIELIGGNANDLADAREWCSLFAPEVVFTSVARKNCAIRHGQTLTR
jgi:hypothetical protein